MEYLKRAWDVFVQEPVKWALFGLVMGMAQQLVIGVFLQPNAIRVMRTAVQNGTAPDIGAYINFDNLDNDFLTMLCLMGAYMAGLCLCCVGIYAAIPLLAWTTHLAAENTFEPIDNLRASFAHAKSNAFPILFQLVAMGMIVGIAVFFTCGLAAFVAAPILMLAVDFYFLDNRDDIYQAAAEAGIQRIA